MTMAHNRDALGCVPRRVQDIKADPSNHDMIAVVQQHMFVAVKELIFPLCRALVRNIQPGTDSVGKLTSAGNLISVDVSFGNGDDFQVFLLRHFQVLLDVASRIDDHRGPCPLAANRVRGVCQFGIVKVFQQPDFPTRRYKTSALPKTTARPNMTHPGTDSKASLPASSPCRRYR